MNLKSKYLSGGNKRKLQVAISLIDNPKLLLLDEATSGLDMISRRKLLLYIRRISRLNSMTVVLITQRVEEAEEFCDQVYFMKDGRVIESGSPKSICAKYSKGYQITVNLPK